MRDEEQNVTMVQKRCFQHPHLTIILFNNDDIKYHTALLQIFTDTM